MTSDFARASLYEWRSPDEMLTSLESMGDALGRSALLRPGTEYREAFVAARFAKHRSGERVRLLQTGSTPTPDFAIVVDGNEYWFETTEADRPGRKRDLEYSNESCSVEFASVPDEHWVEPDAYFAVVQERCVRKAAKNYERCDGLIIWSNAFPIGEIDRLDAAWWILATQSAQKAFSEVWYHFQGAFRRIQ